MNSVFIFAPHAVGKMTIAQELFKLTGYPLLHNHMTIDLVSHFFDYFTTAGKRLVNLFRTEIINEVATSKDLGGFIFTMIWAFDLESDWGKVREFNDKFIAGGHSVYYVELLGDKDTRLERNATENRLQHKTSKRNVEWSNNNLLADTENYRMNSEEDEFPFPNHLRIDTTRHSANESAELIVNHFNF